MTESILDSIKAVCNLEADDDSFDQDVIMHINSELSVLNQVGIGPANGFMIEDDSATWTDFLEDEARLNMVKTYVFLKLRLIFDPPQTGPLIAAIERQADMFLYRINLQREEAVWVPVVS